MYIRINFKLQADTFTKNRVMTGSLEFYRDVFVKVRCLCGTGRILRVSRASERKIKLAKRVIFYRLKKGKSASVCDSVELGC